MIQNKLYILLGALLAGVPALSHATLKIDMGSGEKNDSYYTFPNLTVTGESGDRGYAVRFMFTRAVTPADNITLPALNSGWVETANSTKHVRVIAINAGAAAAEMEAYLRGVRVTFDASRKGQGVAVLISESQGDANRMIYYSSELNHWYEYVSENSIGWVKAYNDALDRRFMGMKGYLVAVTSPKENDFVSTLINNNVWTAGTRLDFAGLTDGSGKITSDPANSLPYWYWAAGPEWEAGSKTPANSAFYDRATVNGTPVLDSVAYPYSNWDSGEPNNANQDPNNAGAEQCMHFKGSGGKWNDFSSDIKTVNGYIVEFEGAITDGIGTGVAGFTSKKEASVGNVSDNGTAAAPVPLVLTDVLTYAITGANTSQTNTAVVVRDTLPAGLTLVAGSIYPTSGAYDPATREMVWRLDVAVGADTTVRFQAQKEAGASGTLVNVAHITSDSTVVLHTNGTYHEAKMFDVGFAAGANGSLVYNSPANGDTQQVDYGMRAVAGVTPMPAADYRFAGWSHPKFSDFRTGVTVDSVSGIDDYTTVEIVNDVTLTAEFRLITCNLSYNGNTSTSGAVPASSAHDIRTMPALAGNTGNLQKTDACFVGWSGSVHPVVTQAANQPADLKKDGDKFVIISDTMFHAVWAEDKSGSDGVSDSIADYLQFAVDYHKGLPAAVGAAPVDRKLYNNGDKAAAQSNSGTPALTLAEACFTGWSFESQTHIIASSDDVPARLIQPADTFIITRDTTLYAVWATDRSGINGLPDSVADYLQFRVLYDGNSHTGGSPPVDGNLYNNGSSVTALAGVDLQRDNACFIGWSFAVHAPVQAADAVPADLMQGGDVFTISQTDTLHAVWAVDAGGVDGLPDGVPDYLQVKLTYHENSAYHSAGGALPTNLIYCNPHTWATVAGNTNGLYRSPADSSTFTGWHTEDNYPLVRHVSDKPTDMLIEGDYVFVDSTGTDLYVVWAYDSNGDGVADYSEPRLSVSPRHVWPEKDDDDPDNPGYNQGKPDWKAEYDAPGADSWYAGCDLVMTVQTDLDPYASRTIRISYLGALKREMLVGADGSPLAETYVIPPDEAYLRLTFALVQIPDSLEGQHGALAVEIVGGGRDTSAWMRLYNHPSYDQILIRPHVDASNQIDLGISGGTPDLMRSLNGYSWRNAYQPLSLGERESVDEGVPVWLREPGGCWEDKFIFMTYGNVTIHRYVDLPAVEGVTTVPDAGRHYVNSHDDFSFTASYHDGKQLKVTARGFYSDKLVELAGDSLEKDTYRYTLHQLVESWTIAIGPDTVELAANDPPVDMPLVWAYRNTLYIRSDAAAIARIYSMSGVLCRSVNVVEGNTRLFLNRGAYLAVIGNRRFKVMIR